MFGLYEGVCSVKVPTGEIQRNDQHFFVQGERIGTTHFVGRLYHRKCTAKGKMLKIIIL